MAVVTLRGGFRDGEEVNVSQIEAEIIMLPPMQSRNAPIAPPADWPTTPEVYRWRDEPGEYDFIGPVSWAEAGFPEKEE